MVQPHVEYANSVWCPYKQDDIKELEKIQKELQVTKPPQMPYRLSDILIGVVYHPL